MPVRRIVSFRPKLTPLWTPSLFLEQAEERIFRHILDFLELSHAKESWRLRLSRVGALRRLATQFLILQHLIPHLEAATSIIWSTGITSPIFAPTTLRQLFYLCKPMLQKASEINAEAVLSPASRSKKHARIDAEILTSWLTYAEEPTIDEKTDDCVFFEKNVSGLDVASASPGYVNDCVRRFCATTGILRDHLLVEAEGTSLFSISITDAPTSPDNPCFELLTSMSRQFANPQLVTNRTIASVSKLLQSFLDTPFELPPQLSIAAIEKEGIFASIISRMPSSGVRPKVFLENSKIGRKLDHFDNIVMSSLFPPATSDINAVSRNLRPTRLLFMVCLKGFPGLLARRFVHLLHRFHMLYIVQHLTSQQLDANAARSLSNHPSERRISLTSSSIVDARHTPHAPPVRCFVDCNPSGVLIAKTLSSAGDSESAIGVPVLWCGLLPSQLDQLDISELQRQKMTDRDRSLLEGLRNGTHDWDAPTKGELEKMFSMDCKAELQCLMHEI